MEQNTRTFSVEIAQIAVFKKLIKQIKKVDSEISMVFNPKTEIDSGGITLNKLSADKSVLVKVKLDTFNKFECVGRTVIGLDMKELHCMLKTISDDNPIELYMNNGTKNILYIHSGEIDLEVHLMNIENQETNIPKTMFETKITMGSLRFQTICKNLNNNSKWIEIASIGNDISFRCERDNSGSKIIQHCPAIILENNNVTVSNTYESKHLAHFSKCNKFSPTITIFMKNDFPLILDISLGTLGKMYVFITPVVTA